MLLSCTATTLSEEEIIRIYGKRWQIEGLFQNLQIDAESGWRMPQFIYDASTAHAAIVFTRYMLLAMEARQPRSENAWRQPFFFLVDEMADITFNRSLCILMEALMASLQGNL